MSLTTGEINVLFSSDYHCLHPHVLTLEIANRVSAMMEKTFQSSPVAYCILAGDFFHETRQLFEESVLHAQMFIHTILDLCDTYHVKLRVMEGTPLHDRKQSKQFEMMNQCRSLPCDLRYIKDISLITEADGTTWMYVPDPGRRDPDDVLADVRSRIRQEGLEQVDFMVTHTMYRHHVAKGLHITAHDPDAYLNLTKYVVDNGHVHTPSIYKRRFLTNGSVDRLKHGEEEAKGIWLAHVKPNPDDLYLEFIENTKASPHRTLDYRLLSGEEILTRLKEEINEKQPTRQFIRLKLSESVYNEGILAHLKQTYPFVVWDKMIEREEVEDSDEDHLNFEQELGTLQANNAHAVFTDYLTRMKTELTPSRSNLLDQVMKDISQ